MSTTYSTYSMRTILHSGTGCRMIVPDLLRATGARRTIMFTDKGLVDAGLASKIEEIFKLTTRGSGPELVGIFDGIKQDCRSLIVNEAARFARELGADSLLALGGGSVLDTVKGVKYLLHTGLTDIREAIPTGLVMIPYRPDGQMKITHMAIPTTAGTGAEISGAAVIFNETSQSKAVLCHAFLGADIAIMDPELLVGLPKKITAFTGMDALSHAVEALFSSAAAAMSDAHAFHAIRLIKTNLPIACKNGSDLKARENLQMASCMAEIAFAHTVAEYPIHNFAHAFGAKFGIPHGLACAVFMPEVIRLLPELYAPRAAKMAEALSLPVEGSNKDIHYQIINYFRQLLDEVGLPRTFKDYDITVEDIKRTIPAVISDPMGMMFPLSPEVILNVGRAVCGFEK